MDRTRSSRSPLARARGSLGALSIALASSVSFAALAFGARELSQERSNPAELRDGRAVAWIASSTERMLALDPPRDLDLARAAFAIRALASASGEREAHEVELLRDHLVARQRADGSFGSEGSSRPLTWLALGALHGSSRATDVERANRAQAWLLAHTASTTGADRADASQPAAIQRALSFLETARAASSSGAPLDPATIALDTLAGGPFDARAVYANAIDAGADRGPSAVEIAASPWLGEPLYELALSVAVLDHYRTSVEAGLLAEASRPSAEIQRELSARYDTASGAWASVPGGAPSLVASACALTILDTLARWDDGSRAQPSPLAAGKPRDFAASAMNCEECHERLQPAQFAQWRSSAHARAHVGCAECHGSNHSQIFRESGRVAPSACARCHPRAVTEFASSKHAHAEETLLRSALFEATAPAARAACMTCHRIGVRQVDGTTGACNSCHPAHAFDAQRAREPEACTLCHTGADYPQDLAYQRSKHGALYQATRDPLSAPTCASCHQPGGRHDDGFGLTLGGSGSGALLAGSDALFGLPEISSEDFASRRAEMVGVCTQCHSSRLAEASLRQADQLKREGEAQLVEATRILRELDQQGYFGTTGSLEIGPEHARPDPAQPGAAALERFYEMWRFHHATAWKGAYHQSASVANNQSGPGTREDLEFLRAEAERWRAQRAKR